MLDVPPVMPLGDEELPPEDEEEPEWLDELLDELEECDPPLLPPLPPPPPPPLRLKRSRDDSKASFHEVGSASAFRSSAKLNRRKMDRRSCMV